MEATHGVEAACGALRAVRGTEVAARLKHEGEARRVWQGSMKEEIWHRIRQPFSGDQWGNPKTYLDWGCVNNYWAFGHCSCAFAMKAAARLLVNELVVVLNHTTTQNITHCCKEDRVLRSVHNQRPNSASQQ